MPARPGGIRIRERRACEENVLGQKSCHIIPVTLTSPLQDVEAS